MNINELTQDNKDIYYKLFNYLESPKLLDIQKVTLKHWVFVHLKGYDHELVRHYVRYVRDFGILIKKPYEEASIEDFNNYKEWLITKQSSKNVLIQIGTALRRFYKESQEKWSEEDKRVQALFQNVHVEEMKGYESKHPSDNNTKVMMKKMLCSNELIEEQKILLNEFHKHLSSGLKKRLSIFTIHDYIKAGYHYGRFIKKPFKEATKKDIENFLYNYITKKDSTMDFYKFRLIQLYRFIYDTKETPDIVKDIELSKKIPKKTEDEMLTPTIVKKLISALTHSRDKAMIAVIYDGALRLGEASGIKIKDIIIDDYGAKVAVDGKTGKRVVRLIDSVPYLQECINNHPFKDNPNSFLFISFKPLGQRLLKRGFQIILRKAVKLAEINMRVHLHLLRHSRLNFLAKEGFNERDLRIFAGWSATSNMPNTYLHYGQEAVEKKLLEKHGLLKNTEKEILERERESMKPITCVRCNKVNPSDAKYCNCGMALDIKTATEDTITREIYDSRLNEMLKDPRIQEAVKSFMERELKTRIN